MICPHCQSEITLNSSGPTSLKFWVHPKADCRYSGRSFWDVPRFHEMFQPTATRCAECDCDNGGPECNWITTPKETDNA